MLDTNVVLDAIFIATMIMILYSMFMAHFDADNPIIINTITVPIIRVITCISTSPDLTPDEKVMLMDVVVYTMTHDEVRSKYDDDYHFHHELLVYRVLSGGIAVFLDNLKAEKEQDNIYLRTLQAILEERLEFNTANPQISSEYLYKLSGPKWPSKNEILYVMDKAYKYLPGCIDKNANVKKLIKEST